jgi:hypothetical protein
MDVVPMAPTGALMLEPECLQQALEFSERDDPRGIGHKAPT